MLPNPPSTEITKLSRVNRAASGGLKVPTSPTMAPAAAARAAAIPAVSAYMWRALMPISRAAVRSIPVARMAIPVRLRLANTTNARVAATARPKAISRP